MARMAETPCHLREVPAGAWGKAVRPDLTSLPPFAHEQDTVAQGVPLVSVSFIVALCEVFLYILLFLFLFF